uniref:hypothetical protein n=1 Tax=Massilia sp. TaxID=1882437 RepID=UPI0028A247DB
RSDQNYSSNASTIRRDWTHIDQILDTMQPFAPSKLKLRRAMRHIEELDEIIKNYFSGAWYSYKNTVDSNGSLTGLHVNFRAKPEEFGTVVGDAIHNMRSALDLAAVELVRLNNGDTKGVMFPFARNEQEFLKALKNKNIDRASMHAQELIKELRPYGGGNEVLRSLHELDIQDKHHTLIPNTTFLQLPPISIKTDENGKPIGFDEGRLQIVMDESVSPQVQFVFPDDCPLKGHEIISGLRHFHADVTTIIENFCFLYGPQLALRE